jgi:hypothetical protein
MDAKLIQKKYDFLTIEQSKQIAEHFEHYRKSVESQKTYSINSIRSAYNTKIEQYKSVIEILINGDLHRTNNRLFQYLDQFSELIDGYDFDELKIKSKKGDSFAGGVLSVLNDIQEIIPTHIIRRELKVQLEYNIPFKNHQYSLIFKIIPKNE